jgi:reactive chlorine resistance protein C
MLHLALFVILFLRRLKPEARRRSPMSAGALKTANVAAATSEGGFFHRALLAASKIDRIGMGVLRLGLVIVLVWIGGLKFVNYEADSIVPLVANSPLMSFFYHHPAPEYKHFMNKEGELVPAHHEWHESNGTYPFSHGLGVVIILIGVLIALYPISARASALGSFILIFMAFTTLSFLVTTPEAWVPAAGDAAHGFPYLSGVGRLVIKDAIMLGAAIVTLADAAKTSLGRKN